MFAVDNISESLRACLSGRAGTPGLTWKDSWFFLVCLWQIYVYSPEVLWRLSICSDTGCLDISHSWLFLLCSLCLRHRPRGFLNYIVPGVQYLVTNMLLHSFQCIYEILFWWDQLYMIWNNIFFLAHTDLLFMYFLSGVTMSDSVRACMHILYLLIWDRAFPSVSYSWIPSIIKESSSRWIVAWNSVWP